MSDVIQRLSAKIINNKNYNKQRRPDWKKDTMRRK